MKSVNNYQSQNKSALILYYDLIYSIIKLNLMINIILKYSIVHSCDK